MSDDAFENVLVHFHITRRRGDSAEVRCPAHEDRVSSLSISRGVDHPVVMHCHAGCSTEQVVRAVGLSMSALTGGEPHPAAEYRYVDAHGRLLYSVERWVPKTFRPKLPDGTYARPRPADEVLYNLPTALAAVQAGRPIYLVEGERDVETARGFDLVATTAMSGATQPWLPQFTEALTGGRVIVVADNDGPGRTRARRLVTELEPYAASVRAVVPRFGKDLSEHLWAGFSPSLLDPLPAEGTLLRFTLAHTVASPIDWAWEGWIPGGMLALIEGDPGEGKSVLTVDLAARWTTGAAMPDGTPNPFGGPVSVGMVSAEDDVARVIKPRFVAAGGNPHRLVYVAGMPLVGGRYSRSIDLDSDVEALREAIEAEGLRVLVLDPLMAFMGSTRTAIDAEVRKVLTPLRYLAEETDCAIIAVRHLRKAGGKAAHAGGGSIAFTGAARSVMLVARSPRNTKQHVLASTKINLALAPESLAYELDSSASGGLVAPVVRWTGLTDLTATDLLKEPSGADSVRAEVREELKIMLAIESLEFSEIIKRLHSSGVEASRDTVYKALGEVAVKIHESTGTAAQRVLWKIKADFIDSVPPKAEPEAPEPVDNPEAGSQETHNPQPSPPFPYIWKAQTRSRVGENVPFIPAEPDEAIACVVCGQTEAIAYYEELRAWRCADHIPDLEDPA